MNKLEQTKLKVTSYLDVIKQAFERGDYVRVVYEETNEPDGHNPIMGGVATTKRFTFIINDRYEYNSNN